MSRNSTQVVPVPQSQGVTVEWPPWLCWLRNFWGSDGKQDVPGMWIPLCGYELALLLFFHHLASGRVLPVDMSLPLPR